MKVERKLVLTTLLSIISLLLTSAKVYAITHFYSDGVIQAGDSYQDVYSWNNATVDMTGGEVTRGFISKDFSTVNFNGGRVWLMRSYDNSTINVTGGRVDKLSSRDNSTINFSGGELVDNELYSMEQSMINFHDGEVSLLYCVDNSTINFTGGQVYHLLGISGPTTINISGGRITGHLMGGQGGCVINIYGYDLHATYSSVTGIWENGTHFEINLENNLGVHTYDHIVLHEFHKPVADADGPYSIYVGDTLTLDASDSTDDGNDIVSYMWDLDDDENFEIDASSQPVFDVNFTYLQSLGLLINHTYTIHLKVTDSEAQSDTADSTLTIVPKPALAVAVDIKPGSCPNPVNVKSSSVLPIAILGTDDCDVTTIDPTSIRLAGVEPLRSSFEDVATPVSDSNDCNCITDGPDGFLDLTLKFKTQSIVEAVGDVNDGDVRILTLTGVLFDPMPFETPIEGADCILIRGRHKPINRADINKDGVVDVADFAVFAQNWLQCSVVQD